MTSSEKFCLKWNDFENNVSSSFKELREDFCDVTLVGEDHTKIEAHKVILAGSSNFFRELLKRSQHPHPLLYLKGIKGCHLSAVVDFMYQGEVSIDQEDLNDFLLVAEELQLKGLTTMEEDKHYDKNIINQQRKPKKVPAFQNDFSSSMLDDPNNRDNETIYEEKIEISNTRAIVSNYPTDIKTTTNIDQLDSIINSMLDKLDGIWTCNQCGKTDKSKRDLGNHVEAKHIEGVSHPCKHCGKLFRSKNSRKVHMTTSHRS